MFAKQDQRATLGRNLPRIHTSLGRKVAYYGHLNKEDTCVWPRGGSREEEQFLCLPAEPSQNDSSALLLRRWKLSVWHERSKKGKRSHPYLRAHKRTTRRATCIL